MKIISAAEFERILNEDNPVTRKESTIRIYDGLKPTGFNNIWAFVYLSNGKVTPVNVTKTSVNQLPADEIQEELMFYTDLGDGFYFIDVENTHMTRDLQTEMIKDFQSYFINHINENENSVITTKISDPLDKEHPINDDWEECIITNDPEEISKIIDMHKLHNRLFITFDMNGVSYLVPVTWLVEDSLLRVVNYNSKTHVVNMAGFISGKSVYQSVKLEPSLHEADRAFVNVIKNKNNESDLWWVRHNGVIVHKQGNSVLLRTPRMSPRNVSPAKSELPADYDYILNRLSVI